MKKGKEDEPRRSSRGLEFLPSCPPLGLPPIWQALVKTIPQLLVTRQIQLPFPLRRGARARGNTDRQRQREKERRGFFFFFKRGWTNAEAGRAVLRY